MLAVQYLEPGPDVATLTDAAARAQLRIAFARLPVSDVILGWDLPAALRRACAEEIARAGARLYRWHPLLSGDVPAWQTVGLGGTPVPGFQGRPEFTFLCPNRPAVFESVLEDLRQTLRSGQYQGVFLDRIRYPSPTADPASHLACFCADCHRAAAAEGLDLTAARQRIQALLTHRRSFVRLLLDPAADVPSDDDLAFLRRFLDFRARSVTRIVQAAADIARAEGLLVGLDCFSPALSRLVGQDLAALDASGDWIKIMTYGHTLAPAGLPFELLGLARWLIGRGAASEVSEAETLGWLAAAARLPLPPSFAKMLTHGVSPAALASETQRARAAGVRMVLAGVELVDIEGVTRLDPAQVAADLRAFRAAGPAGLVLSWDLRLIPAERLEIVHAVWCTPHQTAGPFL